MRGSPRCPRPSGAGSGWSARPRPRWSRRRRTATSEPRRRGRRRRAAGRRRPACGCGVRSWADRRSGPSSPRQPSVKTGHLIGLPPMLRVRLLGELQAEADGEPIAMPASRRAWALLAWLALHPGEHARGAVAARFWPDVLDSSARASLRSALWELRRALGDDAALTAGRDRIALRCETDLAEFDAHVAAGRLEDAVALHRGPLLADLDDDWVLEARDEHAERLGAALARLAAAAERPADAVGWARRRLALDPLDEDAARDLMRRLADAGDRPGALAAYDRLSDRLRSALGLAPSAETRALVAEVRAEAPAERPARAAPGRPASTTLEG